MSTIPPYVGSIQANAVLIRGAPASLESALSPLHPLREKDDRSDYLVISIPDWSVLPSLLTQFRDMGLPFGGETHGWPPAAVFEDLREKGLVSGQYVEIIFGGPSLAKFYAR
jgi:hypothetical protein